MKTERIIEMVPGKDGVYEPSGEVYEPTWEEKKRRAERVYQKKTRSRQERERERNYQRRPETFLDGFGQGLRFVGSMNRKIEEFLNDALGEED